MPTPVALVGRDADLSRLHDTLDHHAFVTLVGPPGVGKTSLALNAAHTRALAGDDVRIVSLVGVADVEQAIQRVASALDRNLSSSFSASRPERWATLGPVLIVIDNAEQVATGLGQEIATWASHSRRFLLTSRLATSASQEVLVPLEPLDHHASRRLFLQRAHDAGHAMSTRSPGLIDRLLTQLDGLPLCIEVSAGRLQVMGIREQATALSAAPTTSTPQGAANAAIALSWRLLSTEEQDVLAHCAVFVGGASLSAIAAILDRPVGEVAPTVHALVHHSLVHVTDHPTLEGVRRFRLLETVRRFCLHTLILQGTAPVARTRHAEYFASWATPRADRAVLSGSPELYGELSVDRANLEAALSWASEQPGSVAAELAMATAIVARRDGDMGVLFTVYDQVLGQVPLADTVVRARLLLARAHAHDGARQTQAAMADLRAALAIATDDPRVAPKVRERIAFAHLRNGEVEQAAKALTTCLSDAQRHGDTTVEAKVLANQVKVDLLRHAYANALSSGPNALLALEAIGAAHLTASLHIALCEAAIQLDLGRRAMEHAQNARRIWSRSRDVLYEAVALFYLGFSRCVSGDTNGIDDIQDALRQTQGAGMEPDRAGWAGVASLLRVASGDTPLSVDGPTLHPNTRPLFRLFAQLAGILHDHRDGRTREALFGLSEARTTVLSTGPAEQMAVEFVASWVEGLPPSTSEDAARMADQSVVLRWVLTAIT